MPAKKRKPTEYAKALDTARFVWRVTCNAKSPYWNTMHPDHHVTVKRVFAWHQAVVSAQAVVDADLKFQVERDRKWAKTQA